ncbi:hypothetical protein VW23_003930 [Devosia insulae DS-56]|uniref:Glycosyltransferase RgtA/B/C/D-like domain-containing protein n=1 Tax=Devosia insulae DS-56 TaxID=1116389 RepID=A0A1E5XJ27_9HYPH|nr:hypothetical protein [Devosia insulae]OEO28600.1 hypothetical protein VW23_003930 [Devosia insulae DS-56]
MRIVKAAIIFLLAFIAFARLAPQDPFNPQHVTRIALALSLSEGRVDIDQLAAYTIDRSSFDGHYYADKPPGVSMLAVPSVMATRAVLEATGATSDPSDPTALETYIRIAAITVIVLPAALAVLLVYLMAARLGASHGAATFAASALAVGTPYFGWSATLFAHALSGAMLTGAMAFAVLNRPAGWVAPVAGLLLGFLLVVDLTAAPAGALVGLFILLRSEQRIKTFTGLAIGGLIGLMPLLVYNQLAFASPFRLGYSQVQGFAGMQQGFFGIGLPQPMVLGELLFGRYRGLLPLAPVLLLVPIGLWAMFRYLPTRGIAVVIAGVVLSFLLINAGYYYWDGGSSTGPRHLVAALPLASLALAFAWPPGLPAKVVALLLLLASLFISFVVASVDPMSPPQFGDPLFDYLLPAFFQGGWLPATLSIAVIWAGFAIVGLWPDRSGAERHQLPA